MIDFRSEPGAPCILVNQSRILNEPPGKIGLDKESIKRPGLRRNVFLLHDSRSPKRDSTFCVQYVNGEFSLSIQRERKLNSRAIIWCVFKWFGAHNIP